MEQYELYDILEMLEKKNDEIVCFYKGALAFEEIEYFDQYWEDNGDDDLEWHTDYKLIILHDKLDEYHKYDSYFLAKHKELFREKLGEES